MAESDFRDSATRHHDRHHRNARRGAHTDEDNSHAPEPARRGGKHNQHEEEKSKHKERKTKMTKRTARIVTSIALLMTIFGAADRAFASRTFRVDETRANRLERTLRADAARFSRGDIRLGDTDLRERGNWGVRFERDRNDVYRADSRNGWRISEDLSFRTRVGWPGKELRQRERFSDRNARAGWDIGDKVDSKKFFRAFRAQDSKDELRVRPDYNFGIDGAAGDRFASFID